MLNMKPLISNPSKTYFILSFRNDGAPAHLKMPAKGTFSSVAFVPPDAAEEQLPSPQASMVNGQG